MLHSQLLGSQKSTSWHFTNSSAHSN